MSTKRYPKIHIRSKNELAKHISSHYLPKDKAIELINDSLTNFDQYWSDHSGLSQPNKGKWVRDASRTNLGKLLKRINSSVLKPHDTMLPNFIFGGVTGLNHKSAVKYLLGNKRGRVMLKLDVTKFFEQIRYERVYSFFLAKAQCGERGSKLLADLCCVYYGPKEKPGNYRTLARGFATSSRLSVWCNLDTFIRLEQLVKKELGGKDPRIAIYVDDIAITASGVKKEDLMKLYTKINKVLEADKKQILPLNDSKTKIVFHSGETYDIGGHYLGKWGFEHLGIQMNRNSLTLGTKTRWKLVNLTAELKSLKYKDKLLNRSRKSTLLYKNYIEK